MDILLHGCNGKMGQVISKLVSAENDMRVVCGVDIFPDKYQNSYPVYRDLFDVSEDVDILIDFSYHTCINSIMQFCTEKNIPAVICTTGFDSAEKERLFEASKKIPVLNSSNMSVGVNLLLSLAKKASEVLYDDFDIEIVEKHHNQKLDSPSGTAVMIADAINESLSNSMEFTFGRHSKTQKRSKNEIGIHSIRGGAIVGEHDVIFAGSGEVIQISHTALSRDVFGVGAIRAAKFLKDLAPGLYSMKDVIG